MRKTTVGAALLLMALGGCEQLGLGGGGDENAQGNAAANQAAGGKDPAGQNMQLSDAGVTTSRSLQPVAGDAGGKPAAQGTVSPAMLVGSWGDNGDCTKDVELFADGTFASFNGGQGQWRLEGDQLIFSWADGGSTMRLQSVDADNLIVINPDGSTGRSQRC